jgi:mono/diheme cytochrome c family protein
MTNVDRITRVSRLSGHARLWLSAALGMMTLPLAAAPAPGSGDYTKQQAQVGAQIYSGTCSVCHGSRLQGGAAPALTGAAFAQSLTSSYTTTSALFTLISTQMPVNNPGSLSKQQYTQVLAFILAKNGYPSGSAPLDAAHLDEVALLPYPDQDAKQAPDANLEIANIGSANVSWWALCPTRPASRPATP